jgi:galactose mutarotase-like enzyme
MTLPADGVVTPRLWLRNDQLSVAFLPALGGKIVALQDRAGREYLSRSGRPYALRKYGMKYGDTEFDGIDELFPSLGACEYPAGPWKGRPVPGHGEIFQMPWQSVAGGTGVTLEVASQVFPYVFRRQATLDGSALVLDYAVTNTAAEPFRYLYTFHPLFAAAAGCRLDVPDDMQVTVSWSKNGWLGQHGETKTWGTIRDADGGLFKEAVFRPNSGRYYKFFSSPLRDGQLRLGHSDGSGVAVIWPAAQMSRFAVWCSEGGVDGLHHLAIEPTTCLRESLADAVAAGEAPAIPPHGVVRWQIRLCVTGTRR